MRQVVRTLVAQKRRRQNSAKAIGLAVVRQTCFCLVDINTNELRINVNVNSSWRRILTALGCIVRVRSITECAAISSLFIFTVASIHPELNLFAQQTQVP